MSLMASSSQTFATRFSRAALVLVNHVLRRFMLVAGFAGTILAVSACGGGGGGSGGGSSSGSGHVAGTWALTGALASGRQNHTQTTLADGKVLVVGGANLASAELYDPATGLWTATGSLNAQRWGHTATLLSDGRVLVTGGGNSVTPLLSNSEIYDPTTGTWTFSGALLTSRTRHTSTLLDSGRVLVAGGQGVAGDLYSSEIFDPATSTWSAGPNLGVARFLHTATKLIGGKVLVAGGAATSGPTWTTLASAELFDPVANTWTAVGTLLSGRYYATTTLLNDGKVLIAGGNSGAGFRYAAELYDPVSQIWISTGSLAVGRNTHAAVILADGRVLVAGGIGDTTPPSQSTITLSSTEIYDPIRGSWSSTGSLNTGRSYVTATRLNDGKVIISGGYDFYNPAESPIVSTELYY